MLLSCPSCGTRYLVDPAALGAIGRVVRCARCQHTWYQDAPDDATPQATAPEPDAEVIPPAKNLPAIRRPPRRRGGAALAWLALVAVLAAVVLGGWFGRERLVAAWPPALHVYERIGQWTGLPLAVAVDRPVIQDVQTVRDRMAGRAVLIVEGRVHNPTAEALEIPNIRIVLFDEAGARVTETIYTPSQRRLEPGQSRPFRTHIFDPPDEAADLSLDFVEG